MEFDYQFTGYPISKEWITSKRAGAKMLTKLYNFFFNVKEQTGKASFSICSNDFIEGTALEFDSGAFIVLPYHELHISMKENICNQVSPSDCTLVRKKIPLSDCIQSYKSLTPYNNPFMIAFKANIIVLILFLFGFLLKIDNTNSEVLLSILSVWMTVIYTRLTTTSITKYKVELKGGKAFEVTMAEDYEHSLHNAKFLRGINSEVIGSVPDKSVQQMHMDFELDRHKHLNDIYLRSSQEYQMVIQDY